MKRKKFLFFSFLIVLVGASLNGNTIPDSLKPLNKNGQLNGWSSFINSCPNCTYDGKTQTLTCACKNAAQKLQNAMSIRPITSSNIGSIQNNNGILNLSGKGPSGDFLGTCENCLYDLKQDTISCLCKKADQTTNKSYTSPVAGNSFTNSNGILVNNNYSGLGDFANSCNNCIYKTINGLMNITCSCPDKNGKFQSNSIQMTKDDFWVYLDGGKFATCSLKVIDNLQPAVKALFDGNIICFQAFLTKKSPDILSDKFNISAVSEYVAKNPSKAGTALEYFFKNPQVCELSKWNIKYNFNFMNFITTLINAGVSFTDFILENYDSLAYLNNHGSFTMRYFFKKAAGGGSGPLKTFIENYVLNANVNLYNAIIGGNEQLALRYLSNFKAISHDKSFTVKNQLWSRQNLFEYNSYVMLIVALENNMPKVVELLLQYGADPHQEIEIGNNFSITPIEIALLIGSPALVAPFLNSKNPVQVDINNLASFANRAESYNAQGLRASYLGELNMSQNILSGINVDYQTILKDIQSFVTQQQALKKSK